jgi:hypothetical protein
MADATIFTQFLTGWLESPDRSLNPHVCGFAQVNVIGRTDYDLIAESA